MKLLRTIAVIIGRLFSDSLVIRSAMLATVLLAGCSAKTTPPPPIASSERDAIKHSLASLGARVTSDSEDGLYVSLRNTFVEIHDTGGMVNGSYKTQQDYTDFANVNDVIAKAFLAGDDYDQFKKGLRTNLSTRSAAPQQAEYKRLKLTLSRMPLHTIFSLNPESE